jgi:Protein of unknown function (DUF1592)/Protein of unknown function (DUF1588)/Protein of unknown function (DUF1595)/Protein of unknown function (DUF1585)/Protein of unknown function (DUF1587)
MDGSQLELRRAASRAARGQCCAWFSACFALIAGLAASGCSGALEGPQGPNRLGGATGDGASTGTGRGPDGASASAPQSFTPAPAALRKLTLLQYQNSVRDLLGSDIKLPEELEPDSSLNGFFAIGAAKATVSPSGAEKLETAAYALAAQALDSTHRKAFVGCTPSAVTDSDCASQVIARFGRRAFRRPLTEAEAARYLTVAEKAQGLLNDFHAGLEFAVAGILQSPSFVFRVELGRDGTGKAKERPYDDYEMATRLSFLLWNSTPDPELLDAAQRGTLANVDGLSTQVERLLGSARAKTALADFHSERLMLGELNALEKDASLYKGFDDALRSALRKDVLSTIEELTFGASTDFRDLLTTRVAFVEPRLAQIYGLSGVTSAMRVELPSSAARIGLLGKPAFLAINAHEGSTSPTKRGKYVREQLLCQSIGSPPPEVVTVLPEPDPNAPTMRDRLAIHSQVAYCAGCHTRMDPIGLSLEHFDALGRFRESDQGHALDTSGELDGQSFDGEPELAQLLRDDPRSSECVARHLYRYAVAHVETSGEEKTIAALVAAFEDSGYSFKALVRAVATSDGFRLAGEVQR